MTKDPISLEERIAHLERMVDELSDIVARQDGDLRRLTERVRLMLERERDREAAGSGGVVMGDERPPHW